MKKVYNSVELAWLIRRHAVEMTHISHGSHIGSVLSCADIIGVLYSNILKQFPDDPRNCRRDYFVMSKGHAGAGLYAALAECGYFDRSILSTYYQDGSILSGHVSHKKVPGVDVSTGSLGHGLSYALGIAYALKKNGMSNKVYCLLGDGECQEGSTYEAMILASQLQLSNLYIIIDYNKMQAMGSVEAILTLEPLLKRLESFNLDVKEVDGHNHDLLLKSFNSFGNSNKPHALICHTIKGKGVKFMENNILWHYRFPHEGEEYLSALSELNSSKPETINDPYTE